MNAHREEQTEEHQLWRHAPQRRTRNLRSLARLAPDHWKDRTARRYERDGENGAERREHQERSGANELTHDQQLAEETSERRKSQQRECAHHEKRAGVRKVL